MKGIIDYKKKAIVELDNLGTEKLKEAVDYIEFLREKEEEEELLSDKEFIESFKRGKADIKTGRTVRWKDIKNNV